MEVESGEENKNEKEKSEVERTMSTSSAVSLKQYPSSWSLNSSSPLLPRPRKRSLTISSLPPNPEDILDKRDPKGRTPLFLAVKEGDLPDAKRLIEMGCKVNLTDNYNVTPLHAATEKLNGDMIELLVEYGADINAKNILGQTPLMRAVLYDDIDVVKLLHHSGADLNVTDCTGKTALLIGLQEGRIECCSYLIKHKCDVNLVDKLGQSTLYIAIRCCKNPSSVIVRKLMKAGYDIKRDNSIWLKMSELNRYTFKRKSFLDKVKDKVVRNRKSQTEEELVD